MSVAAAWTVSKIVLVAFKSLTYCLRVVSGPLLMRKWPVFVINGWLFMVKSVSCRQNDKRRNNKTRELMRKQ